MDPDPGTDMKEWIEDSLAGTVMPLVPAEEAAGPAVPPSPYSTSSSFSCTTIQNERLYI
jgi:hypothetical protein